MGYNFSAPIFIAPAARAVYGNERAELNFVDAAASENILYTVGHQIWKHPLCAKPVANNHLGCTLCFEDNRRDWGSEA